MRKFILSLIAILSIALSANADCPTSLFTYTDTTIYDGSGYAQKEVHIHADSDSVIYWMLNGVSVNTGVYDVSYVHEYFMDNSGHGVFYDVVTPQVPFVQCTIRHSALTAQFTTNQIDTVGHPVQFTDHSLIYKFRNSTLSVWDFATNYRYDFGDGNISTDQNPTHTFSDTGTFAVTLYLNVHRSFDDITNTQFDFNDIVIHFITIVDAVHNVIDTTDTTTSSIQIIEREGTAQIYASNKQVTVNSETNIDRVQVFSLTGQLVSDFKAPSDRFSFSLSELTNGVYIVSVIGSDGVLTNRKVFIN